MAQWALALLCEWAPAGFGLVVAINLIPPVGQLYCRLAARDGATQAVAQPRARWQDI